MAKILWYGCPQYLDEVLGVIPCSYVVTNFLNSCDIVAASRHVSTRFRIFCISALSGRIFFHLKVQELLITNMRITTTATAAGNTCLCQNSGDIATCIIKEKIHTIVALTAIDQ